MSYAETLKPRKITRVTITQIRKLNNGKIKILKNDTANKKIIWKYV